MPDERTIPATADPTANGHTAVAESPLARARRILAGEIRPGDYLPVPDDVIAFVDAAEAQGGVKMLPEYRQLMIDDLVLQHHHAGDIVLCRYTADGVIVLAAGPDHVHTLEDSLSRDQLAQARVAYPASDAELQNRPWL